MKPVDPDLLRAFVAVSMHRSFTRAAIRLHLTQSTVSHQIRRLEEVLGTQLLERNSRTIKLTGDGEAVLGFAQKILELNDQIASHVAKEPGRGRWRIGLSECIPTDLAAGVIDDAARRLPGVRVSFAIAMSAVLREATRSGELDLALIATIGNEHNGEAPLWRKPLVWASGAHFRPRRNELLPVVLCAAPCINREAAISALQEQGIAWFEAVTVGSYAKIADALKLGLGVSVLAQDELNTGLRDLSGEGFPSLPEVSIGLINNERKPVSESLTCIVEECFKRHVNEKKIAEPWRPALLMSGHQGSGVQAQLDGDRGGDVRSFSMADSA
jgi:DNA-binding transcriptional LysR family regulator